MDYLKYHLVTHLRHAGGRPAAVFYPVGHPTLYACDHRASFGAKSSSLISDRIAYQKRISSSAASLQSAAFDPKRLNFDGPLAKQGWPPGSLRPLGSLCPPGSL
jgi:hypothetical protein